MQVTFYSVMMAVLWSSLFVIIFSVLQKSYYFINISSVYGVVLLYLFCTVRMFIPVEFPWTGIVPSVHIYNNLFLLFTKEILHIGMYNICIYHLFYGIWALAAFAIAAHIFCQYYKYNKIIKNLPTKAASPEALEIIRVMENKYNKKTEVVISPSISEPVSFGIIHGKILLPDNVYSKKELYYIISHEFVHIANYDLLIQMMVNILCAFYWWNPFVYFLRNSMEKSFELRCDYMVIKDLNYKETAEYLETILKVFKNQNLPRQHTQNNASVLGAADNIREIEERFRLISRIYTRKSSLVSQLLVMGVMVLLMVLSYSFIVQPDFQPSKDEIETSPFAHEVNASSSYIIKYADGIYVLKTNTGDKVIIDKEIAEYFANEHNLKIIQEESKYEKN